MEIKEESLSESVELTDIYVFISDSHNTSVNDNFMINIKNQPVEYSLTIKDLQKFQKNYLENYDNFYSKRFKNIDLNKGKVGHIELYKEIRKNIIKKGRIPHIVYEIFDKNTGFIRVGRSSYPPKKRFYWYLLRAFSPNIPAGLATIYYEMAKCQSKKDAMRRFEIKVRYIFDIKGEAQVIEEFLTIFRNNEDNAVGYNLKVNNEYNKVVGDLFKEELTGGFLTGNLNPKWNDLEPIPLADAVLNGLSMGELNIKFGVSPKTIRRRFRAYGYGVNEVYDLKDARAFLLKPYIIEGFKKGLSQEAFFNYMNNIGINIFNHFDFDSNTPHNRGAFFRRMLKQIWDTSKHKEARFQIIADYILSVIDRPNITPGEAKEKLRNVINFKYNREFDRICREIFRINFTQKRDEIFRLLVERLALENKNEQKILLKIAIGLALCRKTDPINIKEKAREWVSEYITRNYQTSGHGLIKTLTQKPYKSLKDRITEHMEHNPLDRPKDIIDSFPNENIETIRAYVKEWKKNNEKIVRQFIFTIIPEYIEEIGFNYEIEDLTIELLDNYLVKKKPDLNVNFKGIIGGALYFACKKYGNPLTQTNIANLFGVDSHTISKWYNEIRNF